MNKSTDNIFEENSMAIENLSGNSIYSNSNIFYNKIKQNTYISEQ